MTAWLSALIFVGGVIFSAGGIVYSTRKELAQNKLDVNRLGGKGREEEKAAARRYHNLCMVIIAGEDNRETRFKVAGMLKED